MSHHLTIQKTLCLIKPDAYTNASAIQSRILSSNFSIIHWERRVLRDEEVRMFYAEHDGKAFFERLCEFMVSGPIIVAVLAAPNAITAWRNLMGPTNTQVARDTQPDSIRAQFGTDQTRNAVHGSDSEASAHREIKFFFPNEPVTMEPLSAPNSDLYIKQNLEKVLIEGLTALAKEKPQDNVRWLADWLLENNPNKPKEMVYSIEE